VQGVVHQQCSRDYWPPLPEISQRAINISIVAYNERFVINWNRHSLNAEDKLFDLRPRLCKRFGGTVNDYKLMAILSDNSPPQESAVIWFVRQDVLEAFRDIVSVASASVVQSAVRINPEYEFRIAMCQFSNRSAPSRIMRSQERKPRGCGLTTD